MDLAAKIEWRKRQNFTDLSESAWVIVAAHGTTEDNFKHRYSGKLTVTGNTISYPLQMTSRLVLLVLLDAVMIISK